MAFKRTLSTRPARASRKTSSGSARSAFAIGAAVFVFLGLILTVLIWVPAMESGLAARASGAPAKVVIEWPLAAADPADKSGSPRSWVPMPVRDELLALADRELAKRTDPFNPSGLKAVSEALLNTGWFEQVAAVRRTKGTIRIEANWRTPAAVVRRNGVDYLVSHSGHLLPLAYQRGLAPVIVVVGAAEEPPMSGGQITPGVVWPGDDIRAALDTVALISSRPWRDQVTAIDVGQYAAKKRIALVSKWNGRAMLGGAPNDTIPGEVAIDVKLRRLDELNRQFGQIDAKHRLVEVAGPVVLVDDVTTAQAP